MTLTNGQNLVVSLTKTDLVDILCLLIQKKSAAFILRRILLLLSLCFSLWCIYMTDPSIKSVLRRTRESTSPAAPVWSYLLLFISKSHENQKIKNHSLFIPSTTFTLISCQDMQAQSRKKVNYTVVYSSSSALGFATTDFLFDLVSVLKYINPFSYDKEFCTSQQIPPCNIHKKIISLYFCFDEFLFWKMLQIFTNALLRIVWG